MRSNYLAVIALIAASASARAGLTVTVPATNSIYFAGKTSPVAPPPGRPSTDFFGDLADASVIPSFVDVTALGDELRLAAEGTWGNAPGPDYLSGPDGRGVRTGVIGSYVEFGVSNIYVEYNTLLGVFTTNEGPTIGGSPTGLAFGDDMSHPLLNQAFAIGSMLDVNVPAGAQRLYLGHHDSGGWYDNAGELTVAINSVPEPSAIVLAVAAGSIALAFAKRR